MAAEELALYNNGLFKPLKSVHLVDDDLASPEFNVVERRGVTSTSVRIEKLYGEKTTSEEMPFCHVCVNDDGNFHVSGTVAMEPVTGNLVEGGLAEQVGVFQSFPPPSRVFGYVSLEINAEAVAVIDTKEFRRATMRLVAKQFV